MQLDVPHSMDNLTIGFQGKTSHDLLEYVLKYHEKISSHDEGLLKALKKGLRHLPFTVLSAQRHRGGW